MNTLRSKLLEVTISFTASRPKSSPHGGGSHHKIDILYFLVICLIMYLIMKANKMKKIIINMAWLRERRGHHCSIRLSNSFLMNKSGLLKKSNDYFACYGQVVLRFSWHGFRSWLIWNAKLLAMIHVIFHVWSWNLISFTTLSWPLLYSQVAIMFMCCML